MNPLIATTQEEADVFAAMGLAYESRFPSPTPTAKSVATQKPPTPNLAQLAIASQLSTLVAERDELVANHHKVEQEYHAKLKTAADEVKASRKDKSNEPSINETAERALKN